jgi:flagellar biosynthesis GTPase FlhF
MPSFFKHHANANANLKGVQKVAFTMHKLKPTLLKKTQHCLNYFMPQGWFFAPPSLAPSTVFDGNDCIWYHGTLYVKETIAVAKMQEQQQQQEHEKQQQEHEKQQQEHEKQQQEHEKQQEQQQQQQEHEKQQQQQEPMIDDDDDTESISSGNSISAFKHPRNVGKLNQLKYLKDGMRLRHMVQSNDDGWYATFDADSNRIIRTQDGVAFDTLRQFARLHCNEVLAITATLTNVWSDPQFQYKDEVDGQWHPLSKLKQ